MNRFISILQDIQNSLVESLQKKEIETTQEKNSAGLEGPEDFSPKNMVDSIPENKANTVDMIPDDAKNTVTEDVSQEFYQMTISYFVTMQQKIIEMLSCMENDTMADKLTKPWLQSKITLADDYISCVHDYLMFSNEPVDINNNVNQGETPDVAERIVEPDPEHLDEYTVTYPYNSMEAKDGLWDNIRKKREREGKNYKPAKTKKEGRPDKDTWNKLTKKNADRDDRLMY
jgi:serine protease inhibitor